MKIGPLLISIIVILIIVCSPVLAISKSKLISQYQTDSDIKPKVPSGSIVEPPIVPTTIPGQAPLGTGTGTLSVTSTPLNANVYLDGVYRGVTPVTITGVSYGVHQIQLKKLVLIIIQSQRQ